MTKKVYRFCFEFNGNNYAFLKITDQDYLNKYSEKSDGTYNLKEAFFVVSLADFYNAPDATKAGYYKVIAKIFQ